MEVPIWTARHTTEQFSHYAIDFFQSGNTSYSLDLTCDKEEALLLTVHLKPQNKVIKCTEHGI